MLSLPIVAHTLLIASAACLVQAHELPIGGAGHLSQRQENAREHFGSLPYGTAIEACNKAGQVALTFDDGPGSLTGELLDLLAYKQTTVTFFITGDHNEGSIDDDSTDKPAILRRMLQDGHQIASHGWSHKDMNTIDEKTQRKEVVRNEEAIAEVLGIIPTYFRPPFGSCDEACSGLLKDLGYHNVSINLLLCGPFHPRKEMNLYGSNSQVNPSTRFNGTWIPTIGRRTSTCPRADTSRRSASKSQPWCLLTIFRNLPSASWPSL